MSIKTETTNNVKASSKCNNLCADWCPERTTGKGGHVTKRRLPWHQRHLDNREAWCHLIETMAGECDYICQGCGGRVPKKRVHCQANIDHKNPKGTNDRDNLQFLCCCCNKDKKCTPDKEWRRNRRNSLSQKHDTKNCTKTLHQHPTAPPVRRCIH